MRFSGVRKPIPKSLVLPLAAFLIRVFLWLSGLWRALGLIEYDGGFYIFLGRSIVLSLMNGDFQLIIRIRMIRNYIYIKWLLQ